MVITVSEVKSKQQFTYVIFEVLMVSKQATIKFPYMKKKCISASPLVNGSNETTDQK